MREALYYTQKEDNKVHCQLCPHNCVIKNSQRGICNVRKNVDGTLYSENYGQVTALGFDPIEKKPLYHFHPGSYILSVGSFGCNMKCDFCQNWEISQATIEDIDRRQNHNVEDIIRLAVNKEDNSGIAYTYNEPTIYYEFMLDASREAKKNGLNNVMVTNGFINTAPLDELLHYIDAFSVDLKGFTEEFYKKSTASRLEPVKKALKQISDAGNFLEITNLVIPTLNDDKSKYREMLQWIYNELGPKTVLHISRYFPNYHSQIGPTSVKELHEFYQMAREYLPYVYLGNVASAETANTTCDHCGKLLVSRQGYHTDTRGIDEEGKCNNCGNKVFIR
jgi:pyruvate formate lyase activating enzyme